MLYFDRMLKEEESTPMKSRGHHCGSSGSEALNEKNLSNDETNANSLYSASSTVSCIGVKRGRPKKGIGKRKCKNWSVKKKHSCKSTTNNNITAIESTECLVADPSTRPDIVMPLPIYLAPRRSERMKHRPTLASTTIINPSKSQTTPQCRSMRLQGISPPPKSTTGEDESASDRGKRGHKQEMLKKDEHTPMKSRRHHCASSGTEALNKRSISNDGTNANILYSASSTVSCIGVKRGRPKKRIGKTKCYNWSVKKKHSCKSTTNNNITAIENTECLVAEPSTGPDIVIPLPIYLAPRRSERIKHRPTLAPTTTVNSSKSQTTPQRRSMRLQGISPPPKFTDGEVTSQTMSSLGENLQPIEQDIGFIDRTSQVETQHINDTVNEIFIETNVSDNLTADHPVISTDDAISSS